MKRGEKLLNKRDLVMLREGIPADFKLICASWMHGLYHGNSKDSWIAAIPEEIFNTHYRNIIKSILELPGIRIRVAALKDDPDVILGYSVSKGETLHWIYVKHAWRKIGIGQDLYPEQTKYITHLTDTGRTLKIKRNLIFDPFQIG